MLKFLRKYNKWIVAIGGAFLMVVFLVPQAIQQLGVNPGNATHMEYELGEPVRVTVAQANAAEFERIALEQIRWVVPVSFEQRQGVLVGSLTNGLQVQLPLGDGTRSLVRTVDPVLGLASGPHASNATEHWIVLARHAEELGLVGGPGDGAQLLDQLTEQTVTLAAGLNRGMNSEQFNELARRIREQIAQQASAAIQGRMTQEQFDRALARAHGVRRLRALYRDALPTTQRDAWLLARNLYDEVLVDLVFLQARPRATLVPEPTIGQIEAHLDEFADTDPEQSPLGIGYRHRDGVTYEALRIQRPAIYQAVAVNRSRLHSIWTRDQERPTPEEDPRAVDTRRYPEDETAAKAIIADEQRRQITDRILDSATRLLQSETEATTRGVPSDGRYLDLPEDWAGRRLSLEVLADTLDTHIREQVEATFEDAQLDDLELREQREAMPATFIDIVRTRDERIRSQEIAPTDPAADRPMDASEMFAFSSLAAARLDRAGDRDLQFPDFMLTVRELGEENSVTALQQGLLYDRPLIGPRGDLVFVRVLSIRPAGANREVDREELLADIRFKEAYDRLVQDADSIEARAEQAGELDALAEEVGYRRVATVRVGTGGMNPGPEVDVPPDLVTFRVSPQGGRIGQFVFDSPELRELIRSRALELRADPESEDLSSAPLSERVISMPVPTGAGLVIAEIREYVSITPEQFASPQVQQVGMPQLGRPGIETLLDQEFRPLQVDENPQSSDPLWWPALRERINYRGPGTTEADELEDNASADDADDASLGG